MLDSISDMYGCSLFGDIIPGSVPGILRKAALRFGDGTISNKRPLFSVVQNLFGYTPSVPVHAMRRTTAKPEDAERRPSVATDGAKMAEGRTQ